MATMSGQAAACMSLAHTGRLVPGSMTARSFSRWSSTADLIVITHRHEVDGVHPVIAAGGVHGDDRAVLTVGEVDVADAPGFAGAHHLGDGFAVRLPQLRLAAGSSVVGRDFGLGLRPGGASS
ncbi:hypothetical protein [Streptomyces sp. MBT33]|uniref:hypothetical protein n=1 Tax=Streptomyces sp. MBT33 TaxID=1488363 RepID=UPI00190AB6F2|nr:hypothetical protein [Streptomyces sp. MBT33]MBK3640185.1 hypothetical protein [Streptomyces sp. MBT33]